MRLSYCDAVKYFLCCGIRVYIFYFCVRKTLVYVRGILEVAGCLPNTLPRARSLQKESLFIITTYSSVVYDFYSSRLCFYYSDLNLEVPIYIEFFLKRT